tara:strand:+ start:554 stop:1819 length:1266 start_codon:yes stop_codon:yes gene_type:complete
MGFFGKIFKSIGKVFTKIGKVIKKAWTSFGKFTNKLGIIGQIGMMFIMPSIASFAMRGLTTLGSGFMTGLGAAAEGTSFLSGIAKVAFNVLNTASKIGKTGINVFRSITSTVGGVLSDATKSLANSVGLNVTMPVIDASGVAIPGASGGLSDILSNATNRVQAGIQSVADIWKSPTPFLEVSGPALRPYDKIDIPSSADYDVLKKPIPRGETIELTVDSALSDKYDVYKEPSYGFDQQRSAAAARTYGGEPPDFKTYKIDGGEILDSGTPFTQEEGLLHDFTPDPFFSSASLQTEPIATVAANESPGLLSRVGTSVVSQMVTRALNPTQEGLYEDEYQDGRRYFPESSFAQTEYATAAVGPGVPLGGPQHDIANWSSPYVSFLVDNSPNTDNMYQDYLRRITAGETPNGFATSGAGGSPFA